MCFVNWINEYQGFVMSVLTLVYVIATICILLANKKAAEAAAMANKQQYSLELLNKRLASYYCLKEWFTIAKTLSFSEYPFGTPLDAFNTLLFNNAQNEDLLKINKQINSIDDQLNELDISSLKREQLSKFRDELVQDRFMKRVTALNAELELIKQIEILFPEIDYEIIKQFYNSFSDTVVNPSEKNIENLKVKTQKLVDNNIINSLWMMIKKI